jgi:hypothetical protein
MEAPRWASPAIYATHPTAFGIRIKGWNDLAEKIADALKQNGKQI